jgi:acyl-CoA reductase-like NAD-dependent aldehyde dehydrogenase
VIDAASQERVVAQAVADGATADRVRELPGGSGWFAAPTVVTGAAPDAPIARDEIFGPVVTLEPVESVEDPATSSTPKRTR